MAVRAVIATALLPRATTLFAADDPLLAAAGNAPGIDRDEAARRLVDRDTPESRTQLESILQNGNIPADQAAVARALAQSSSPDPKLIPILTGLLGPNSALTEAAANALANYRQNPAAFDPLRRFIDNAGNPNPSRIKAVHAVGNVVDPVPADADYLVNLLNQPNQNTGIKDAAAQALADLTGMNDLGKDARRWQQWWNGNKNKTTDQFRAMLLSYRVAQYNLLKQRNAQLAASAAERLRAAYNSSPLAARDNLVLGYLNDSAPDIRVAAIDLVSDNAIHGTSPAIITRLTSLISDSDSVVRLSVADFIYKPPGFDAVIVGPLLDQLAVEKNPAVKKAIANALGKLQDPQVIPRTVPPLIAMLKSGQSDDIKAAANAFVNLGEKLRASDQAKANQVSAVIRQILKPPQAQPPADDVRAACVNALAALRDPLSFDFFINSFNGVPAETVEVREASLDGLGNLGDTRADQVVADQLNDNDPVIRLKAAAALRTVATQGFDQAIYQKMTAADTEPDTRAYLWQAMQHLFDQENPAQLKHWTTQFDKDPEKKLVTLQKLANAFQRAIEADHTAGNAQREAADSDEAASNEQEIADAILAVKQPGETRPTAAQIADAIKHATIALNYWRQPSKSEPGVDDRLVTLVGQILDYRLQSENWTDATDFAAAQLNINPRYAEIVGPMIRDKIDKLKDAEPAEAQKLIDAALAMKPSLDTPALNAIKQIQAELKQAAPPQ
jgi:HEAT repeat protein